MGVGACRYHTIAVWNVPMFSTVTRQERAMDLHFYLTAAAAFAKGSADMFAIFISVLFGSFAFAAALSLRNIGRRYGIG